MENLKNSRQLFDLIGMYPLMIEVKKNVATAAKGDCFLRILIVTNEVNLLSSSIKL